MDNLTLVMAGMIIGLSLLVLGELLATIFNWE